MKSKYNKKPLPDYELLHKHLKYDRKTGLVTWKERRGYVCGQVGDEVGWLETGGYRRMQFGCTRFFIHRIIWFMVTGADPGEMEIDHKNQIRDDNRWKNLRLATDSNNQMNQKIPKHNTSSVKGVSWHVRSRKWIAHIGLNKKLYHLGYFDDLKDAEQAAIKGRIRLHKQFADHGK